MENLTPSQKHSHLQRVICPFCFSFSIRFFLWELLHSSDWEASHVMKQEALSPGYQKTNGLISSDWSRGVLSEWETWCILLAQTTIQMTTRSRWMGSQSSRFNIEQFWPNLQQASVFCNHVVLIGFTWACKFPLRARFWGSYTKTGFIISPSATEIVSLLDLLKIKINV